MTTEENGAKEEETHESYDELKALTIPKLKEILGSRGIDFPKGSKKDDLINIILKAANK